MKDLTLIAAVGKNYELGRKNELLWKIPEDMKFFRHYTLGKPVVMGRKTFESLPKTLPNRTNIVLTRNEGFALDKDIILYHDFYQLLSFIETLNQEVMVIGGSQIYCQFLPFAYKIILTEIDDEDNLADSFFPSFNKDEWYYETISDNSYNDINYKRLVYTKK